MKGRLNMEKRSETIQGTQNEFLHIFRQLCTRRSPWEVWADLMSMIACSISNSIDRTPEHFERREKEYMACLERMGSLELPAQLFGIIVMALENQPEQDFLGKIYMDLELGNHWKGQIFTPYDICKVMSEISCGEIDRQIEEQGYISVCDMACGAGATLIAAANSMKTAKHNFQNHVLFVGQDIDRIVGLMCYIQLSLLGCAGYICIGNSITNPLMGDVLFPQERKEQELWFMPMFQSEIWTMRRTFHMADRLCEAGNKREPHKTKRKKRFWVFLEGDDDVERETSDKNVLAETPENLLEAERDEEENGCFENQKMSKGKPQPPEKVKAKAKEKLEKELNKADGRSLAKPVIEQLQKRCDEDSGLAEDILQKHKTWEKCYAYIFEKSKNQAGSGQGNGFWVDDEMVYEFEEDYNRKDDRAEEAEKARKAAEEEKKRKAAAEAKEAAKAANEKKREAETVEQQKPKNLTGMEGQLDIFSMIEG